MVISHKMVVGWGEVVFLATHCHQMNKSSHAAQRLESRKQGVTRGKRVIGNVWLSIRNTKTFWSARLSVASGLESNSRPLTHILIFIFWEELFNKCFFFHLSNAKKWDTLINNMCRRKRTKWRRTRRGDFDERCNFSKRKCADCRDSEGGSKMKCNTDFPLECSLLFISLRFLFFHSYSLFLILVNFFLLLHFFQPLLSPCPFLSIFPFPPPGFWLSSTCRTLAASPTVSLPEKTT